MIKKIVLFTLVGFLTLSMTCHKKKIPDVVDEPEEDPVSYNRTDRNDVPPPPDSSWSTLDTTNLDYCQQRLWEYLKTMYPVKEENYWDYNIYGIMGEPADQLANRAFSWRYTKFFIDTMYAGLMQDTSRPCQNVDSTFFLQALGQPTCKTYNRSIKQTNYFYCFKLRWRRGPCPYIYDAGNPYQQYCFSMHFDYCSLMKMSFSDDTGRLIYIDRFGAG